MSARRSLALLTLILVSLPRRTSAADKLSDLQARFDHESNAVHKAKLFEKLGDEQFAEARHASQTRDYKSVGEIMERYRDNARATLSTLKKARPNAERQMGGYKQLQIHIHKGIREVDESLLVAPLEYRPPLQLVRQDLASMDDQLLVMLFPRRPEGKKTVIPPPAEIARPPATIAPSPPVATERTEGRAESKPAESAEEKLDEKPKEKPEEKFDMDIKNCLVVAAFTCGLSASCAMAQQKDYLSAMESDKVRDAETTNERIKLFLAFADDRLKKFQYELEHPSSNKHPEMLNALMNGYVGCVDDAADLVQLGIEKQENVREGVDLMASRTKEFLEVLNKIAADKNELEIYKDNLDDAIEGTRDAMNDAEKAKKNVAPPPVRRKN
jgi:hypothetical protein